MRTRFVGHFTRVRLLAIGALLAALSATALATTLVSDAGGYKATDVTVFSFIDVSGSGATVLTGADDGKIALTLPFAFTFFGHSYPMVCVSSNGAAYFIDTETECGTIPNDFANTDLTGAASPGDRAGVFPLWSDLAFGGAGTGVVYQLQGDSPHRKFVLQWNNAYPLSKENGVSPAPVTFEVILLEENNQILFQYNSVDLGGDAASNGGRATVGIRNAGALVAAGPHAGQQIAWSYNSPVLANRKAILFTGSKSTPVINATGGTFPYTGSAHAGSGVAYGTGGLGDVLSSPAVELSYTGILATAYGPSPLAPIDTGTYQIAATFAGNDEYTSGSDVKPLTIAPAGQAIAFTSTAPSGAMVGGATYHVTATGGGSGNAVVFSSLSTGVCTVGVDGFTVSFVGAGTCQVAANQPGNTNYDPAPQQTQSFAVGKGTQTIAFTSTAPSGAMVGGATYHVTATGGGSGNTVVFSSLSTGMCTVGVDGFTVSFVGAGTCQVAANQPGNTNYDPAPQQTQSFAVGKGTQTIAFTSTAPSGAMVGGTTYHVTATGGGSGNTVVFSSLSTGMCTVGVDGFTVSFVGAGTCQVAANQPGNTNYDPAPQQTQSFAVGKGTQAIAFTSTAPSGAMVGGATYHVTATGGGSGNAVVFSSLSTNVCTVGVDGFTVSFVGAGTCQVAANQPGNTNYDPAPQQTQGFAVGKGTQTIAFTSTAPSGATVGGATYHVTATGGGSGNAVVFSSLSTGVCTVGVDGFTVSFVGAGTCQVAANQPGNTNYDPAPQQTQSFAVADGAVTTTTIGSNHNPADPGQDLTITATVKRTSDNSVVKGGTVTFSEGSTVLSGPTALDPQGKASFKIKTLSAGNHTIRAVYSGTAIFAGSSVSFVQAVQKAPTKTDLKSSNDSSKKNENVTFTATVHNGKDPVTDGTVTFKEGTTVLAGPIVVDASGKASFSKSNLSSGEHTITAEYSGSPNYEASTDSVKQKVK